MPQWLKHFLGIFGVMTLAACTGGTAPGATSCGGIKPLPAGFDQQSRIENAASARLTQGGLTFLQDNLGPLATQLLDSQGMSSGGVIQFPIPESSGTALLVNKYTLCTGGPDVSTGKCVAEIDVGHAKITIQTATPHNIKATGTVPIRVKSLPVRVEALYVLPIDTNVAVSGNTDQCDTAQMTFKDVTVSANISVEVERDTAHGARYGYSKIRIPTDGISIDKNSVMDGVHFCPNNLGNDILSWFLPLLGDTLMSGFTGQINTTIEQMLCQKADATATPQCPNGSDPKDGICKYADGACVPVMLGMDGHADLGALMAAIAPGISGGLDFLMAAGGIGARSDDPNMGWGDLNPVKGGATIGLMGGATAVPQSKCVPAAALTLPKDIPIPAELLDNAVTPWTGDPHHVGIALSQSFANYALGGVYNSGALCIGVSTDQVALLHSGILSLLIPSIKSLTYQKKNQAIAIVLRPQKPPAVVFGTGADITTDPLVRVKLDQAMLDIYVFSSDRYIRILTAQFDFDVPINLEVSPEGITPKLDKIYVTNPKVTNSDMLTEDPDKIGKAIADVITGMAGDFLGGIQPIAINGALAALGVTLDIPSDGIRKLTSGEENFIGVFARIGMAQSTTSLQSDTQVQLAYKATPRDGFGLTTHTQENRPHLALRLGSSLDDGSRTIEYSYKLNRGYWHVWTTRRELVVDDPALMLQGHHVVSVVSRVKGQPMTQDRTPAEVRFDMDIDAPRVTLAKRREGGFTVQASDLVSGDEQLKVRYRYDNGAFTSWKPLKEDSAVPYVQEANQVFVEVMDGEENIATSQQELIRGRPDTNPGGAPVPPTAGCSVAPGAMGKGSLPVSRFALMAGAAGIALGLRRRSQRRRLASVVASIGTLLISGTWVGCTCGSSSNPTDPGDPGQDGGGPDANLITLQQGLIGSYTSAQVASDGTIWVAGYEEADWPNGMSYGDLAVGKYDTTIKRVQWDLVDGIPDTEVDTTVYNTSGWRGGQSEAGDDVGLWTSLVLSGDQPRVAYYDATNGALKYASYDGTSWKTHTVYKKAQAEAGRYAKMLLVGGKPVIAFQLVGAAPAGGFARSALMVAKGKSANPASGSDWDFEEIDNNEETPCRQRFCQTTEKCEAATYKCAAVGKCNPDCASGTACIDGGCAPIIDNTKIDSYPDALGGYIAMAVGPNEQLGIVYYDRIHGNLMQARQDKGEWQATRILDGQDNSTPPVDTGDMGVGASLFITDTGDWHIAYCDGFKESLRYMLVKGGTEPQPSETVDTGMELDGKTFADGQHIVGDDSNIVVTKAGDVHIAYQDATVTRLRWATGTPESGSGHKWTVKEISQSGFGGFFPKQVTVNGSTSIVNWVRKSGSVTADVSIVQP